MRIEVLEERLSDTNAATGQHYQLGKGDIVTVPDDYGARLVWLGWAKDVDGKVKTGERKPGPETLTPQKAVVRSSAKTRRR